MKFRNKPTKQHMLFSQTLKDIRKLINSNTNNYRKEVMGLVKNTKMPYTHLVGRRKKLRGRKAQQKAKARQENIQYDSSMTFLTRGLPEPKQKDNFLKNQYKFRGLETVKIGKQKNGFLEITQNQAKNINQSYQGNTKRGKNIKKRFPKKGKGKQKGKR